MKAKVIKTGEIVNVTPMGNGWSTGDAYQSRTFTNSQLDFEYQEWDAFRREAAKDILCAIIQGNTSYDSLYEVHHSVELADELIKQLRDGKV